MMTVDWKVWLGALAVILAGAGWLWIGQLRAEKDVLAIQVQTLARENAGLTAEVEANVKALARREAERARLAEEKAALETKLQEVYERDPEARAWADSPCPDGVIECLRR